MREISAEVFERYIVALRETPPEEHTEHTGRSALQQLLNEARATFGHKGLVVQHEPRRNADKGSPDFKVSRNSAILGYVENKAVGENLDRVIRSEQIKKYRQLSPNLLVTDYLRFVWLDGENRQEARLAEPHVLEGKPQPLRPERIADVSALLQGFFSQPEVGIGRAKPLAEALAVRSHLLRDFLAEELLRQKRHRQQGRLYGLFEEFRRQVSHEIDLGEFADAFAQTLAYGLFLARLSSKQDVPITLLNARTHVPASIGLIRELVGFLDSLDDPDYTDIKWVVEEVLSIINGLKLKAIREDLSFRNRRAKRGTDTRSEEEWRLFSRDPFIYFYEDFLEKYDRSTRESRGVYYTPPPVVNFIVRAVDDILKSSFGIEQGLADRSRVTVLDFACGTGTFLVEVLERIFENVGGAGTAKADGYVRDHMLQNIYGFEYLIAPYTIAHLKLGQYLTDKRHPLKEGERFQVYLTNTLEPIEAQRNALLPELSHETEEAQRIKEKPILVITGNPPYSGHSRNNGPWAKGSVAAYRKVFETDDSGREVENPLGERNPKWLQDDYVKFIRFAQMKMDMVDEGVVGIITNHSFLDNPTFRGMRQSLMRSFNQIYVLDLHGNAKKREVAPDGSRDENVFDIEQGVAISLFVKKSGLEKGVWRADWWGLRQAKYQAAASRDFQALEWRPLDPSRPQYLYVSRDDDAAASYDQWWSVQSIFPVNSVGIVTARDRLSIHFSKAELWTTIRTFVRLDPELAREAFELGNDSQDWTVESAQADLRDSGLSHDCVKTITYQPFDGRVTYFTGRAGGFHCRPRGKFMHHMLGDNIALMTNRSQEIPGEWANAYVVDGLATHHTVSNKEVNYLFPLYLYPPSGGEPAQRGLYDAEEPRPPRQENIAPEFRSWIDDRYGTSFEAEQVFGYIYAVLHAPTYRRRYADFLRADFPRIHFPDSPEDFVALADLGSALVRAHLMRKVPRRGLGASVEQGTNEVEKIRYSEAEEKVWFNEHQGFAIVPKPVWDFSIGGYQVIEKYLKSRKGRKLSLDEIENVEKIANTLSFTIEQMAKIDDVYGVAFLRADRAGSGKLAEAEEIVDCAPEVFGGEPVFRGTRIPVHSIVAMLNAGAPVDELLAGYPKLDRRKLKLAMLWVDAHPPQDESTTLGGGDRNLRSQHRVPRRASDAGHATAAGKVEG